LLALLLLLVTARPQHSLLAPSGTTWPRWLLLLLLLFFWCCSC
jgi:hypothetical protein